MDCKIFCMRMGDRFLNPKSRDYENEDEDLLWNIQTAEECRMLLLWLYKWVQMEW